MAYSLDVQDVGNRISNLSGMEEIHRLCNEMLEAGVFVRLLLLTTLLIRMLALAPFGRLHDPVDVPGLSPIH